MKKITKLISSVSAGAALLWWSLPAYAVDLCKDVQGVNAGKLCGVEVDTIVEKSINVILFVSFVAALLYLIFGGIRWIMSGGDKEATAKAKGTVTAALIGLAVVLASWILINVILTFFGSGLGNLTWPTLV